MIRVLALLVALLALPAQADDLPALYDVTGVAAGDVLNIRAEPSARAQVVATLRPNTRGVEVVELSGTWGKVNTGEGVGYASMTYLRRAGAGSWASLDLPLHCHGTEPFWGLTYDPVAGTATLDDPETGKTALPVTARWGIQPGSNLVALGATGMTAVLRGAACSDGMSDNAFGLALDVFLTGQTPDGPASSRHLTGCCSLARP
ncbi:SH3 domain-containing protein [Fuscovulum blasticum]|uniref:SH3 domain-containing protein n=1 Tax=Fuscovulum blasticum TaxID=1075 RepID=UPI000D3E4B3E|nr:SH3 domain-containing protein [Fuscovulum blasticum]AWD22137.1 hypothetical protein B6K69_10980 [Fuscovulum blasticum]